MNKIKKLSVVFIAMAMVALLGVSVFAIDQADVAYSAKITDNQTRCVSSSAQEVTVAINATKEIKLHSLTAKVALPEGWTIKSMSNTVLEITEDYYNTENGMVVWYGEVDEQNPTMQILQIVIEIPAGTIAGTYDIGLENIELGKISVSGNDWQEISKEIDSLTATSTINDHKFETTASTEIAAEATCSDPALYYVKCDNCPVVNKEKTVPVGDPAADAHNYPATPSSYEDNGDGTHSPKYVCTLNSEHVNVDATVKIPHEYDQDGDKCVCGAVKPATGLKGDVDLDGDVDSEDAVIIFKHAMEAESITDAIALANAEVTGDGEIDSEDAVKVFKYAMEAIDSLD